MKLVYWLLPLSLFIYCQLAFSQNYSISQIPDSLTTGANAVFLVDEGNLEIIHSEKSVFRTHQVIAILNSNAKALGAKTIGYDKIRKINSISAIVYDENGNILKKSKKADVEDYSATSQNNLFDDNRIQHLDMKQNQYPFIVEFWVEQEFKTTYIIPDWYVLPNFGVSTIHSQYSVMAPDSLNPNFSVINTKKEFQVSKTDGITRSVIHFDNILAKKREPYGASLYEISPVIYASPSKFSFDGYVGDFSSWKSIGYWQLELNKGRDELPPETITKIKELTGDCKTKEEKIKRIYEYVQSRTRYVSIQLGIGGMQPFPASQVDELGYGDCKALSNYTQALLKSVDIDSYYTWVYGGSNPPKLETDFPIDQFNHIILCVPNERDTVWLECTSQTNPFGYLGDFTGDREVMVVTEEGGKLVRTPKYTLNENKQITFAQIDITDGRNSRGSIQVEYSGLQHENGNLNYVLNDGDEKLKDWIYKNTDIENFNITNFNFDYKKSKVPSVTESLDLEISNLLSKSGNRSFLVPNLMNKWTNIPKRVHDRKTDVVLKMEFEDIDSISYQVPNTFSVEYVPKNINYNSQFGSYQVNFHFENNLLIYVRKLQRNKGTFPKEEYDELRNFYKTVVRGDKAKVVFIEKT